MGYQTKDSVFHEMVNNKQFMIEDINFPVFDIEAIGQFANIEKKGSLYVFTFNYSDITIKVKYNKSGLFQDVTSTGKGAASKARNVFDFVYRTMKSIVAKIEELNNTVEEVEVVGEVTETTITEVAEQTYSIAFKSGNASINDAISFDVFGVCDITYRNHFTIITHKDKSYLNRIMSKIQSLGEGCHFLTA